MIKVLFFGVIADRLKQREMELSVRADMNIADVISAVACNAYKPLLVALNQVQVNDMSILVQAGDEVAIMPPFSGG
jgi:molybdopterin converting factor small subunit